MLTNKQIKKAEQIRKTAPGYIGGRELVDKASDEQILMLTALQDKHVTLHNQMKDNEALQANIIKAIEKHQSSQVIATQAMLGLELML